MADTGFEVRMSETLAKELEEIANEAQLSKAEVFRRAIALYGLTYPFRGRDAHRANPPLIA